MVTIGPGEIKILSRPCREPSGQSKKVSKLCCHLSRERAFWDVHILAVCPGTTRFCCDKFIVKRPRHLPQREPRQGWNKRFDLRYTRGRPSICYATNHILVAYKECAQAGLNVLIVASVLFIASDVRHRLERLASAVVLLRLTFFSRAACPPCSAYFSCPHLT